MKNKLDVLVLGAGLSGIAAAGELNTRSGLKWVLVDKGRSVGGRMATRRIADLKFDHGAQFFTVRSAELQKVVDDLLAEGVVREWCRGFGRDPAVPFSDGHPRYCVTGGMNRLAKHLVRHLPAERIVLKERATKLDHENGAWSVLSESGQHWRARNLILTMPLPQTVTLLSTLEMHLNLPDLIQKISRVQYDPCVAVMVRCYSRTIEKFAVPLRDVTPELAFIADNGTKDVCSTPGTLTIHLSASASRLRFEEKDEAILTFVLNELKKIVPDIEYGTSRVGEVHRWRYARPKASLEGNFLRWSRDDDSSPLFFAGETFGSPKMETAFLSGTAVGRAVLSELVSPT